MCERLVWCGREKASKQTKQLRYFRFEYATRTALGENQKIEAAPHRANYKNLLEYAMLLSRRYFSRSLSRCPRGRSRRRCCASLRDRTTNRSTKNLAIYQSINLSASNK